MIHLQNVRWVAVLALLAVSSAGLGGCGDDDVTTDDNDTIRFMSVDAPRAPVDSEEAVHAGEAVTALGVDLYAQVRSGEDNLAVSPYSVAVALAMTRAGAEGTTAAEMDTVLHADVTTDLHAAFGSLAGSLAERPGTFPVGEGDPAELVLTFGNAVWPQNGSPIEDDFLRTLAEHYGAGVQAVDYAGDAEGARQAINGWVADRTRDRIPELIPAGTLSGLTRMVLTNAVYLNAPWLHPFAVAETSVGEFTLLDGRSVSGPLMNLNAELRYGSDNGWQAVELPYAGGELSMVVFVPDAGRFTEFEDKLGTDLIDEVNGALSARQVDLGLPPWEFRTQLALTNALRELGMRTAFSDAADFSAMSPEPFLVSDVLHEVFISVDEDGTEAAAATAVVMGITAAPVDPPISLTVDRPYLFWIVDGPTGASLFLGRVTDPTSG